MFLVSQHAKVGCTVFVNLTQSNFFHCFIFLYNCFGGHFQVQFNSQQYCSTSIKLCVQVRVRILALFEICTGKVCLVHFAGPADATEIHTVYFLRAAGLLQHVVSWRTLEHATRVCKFCMVEVRRMYKM